MAALLGVRRCLFAHPLRVRASNYSVSPSSAIHLQARWRLRATATKHRYGVDRYGVDRKTLGVGSNVMPTFPVRSFSLSPSLSGLENIVEYGLKKGIDYLWKRSEETMNDPIHVKILASKPQHAYEKRLEEIEEITAQFDELKRRCGGESVVGVYIKGTPAIGKTQLAREFGEQYHEKLMNSRKYGGTSGKIAVVAMLDARTPASFLRSYLRLAEDLGFPVNRYNAMSSKIQERVAIISIDVQKKLAEKAPDWLLIVDGIDPGCYDRFYSSLPHPGNDDWGEGRVLVTTRHDRIVRDNRCAMHYPMRPMPEEGAVSLLHKVSGFEEDLEGAVAVVNSHYVGKMPLDVVSAGIYIRKSSEKDPQFTFSKYLENVKDIRDLEDEAAQKRDIASGGYPYSSTFFAVAEAARELAESDESLWLKKVFTILALCSHEPLPMSTFERFLKADVNAGTKIKAVRDCDLLIHIPERGQPTDSYDKVERVYFHKNTHKGFKSKFIGGDHKSDAVKEHQELVNRFADCLLKEYKNASTTENPLWMRQLLLPHLEQFHQVFKAHSFDRSLQIQLCVALSYAYLDLNRNPERALKVLEDLLAQLKGEKAHGRDGAILNLGLGKVYRHLGQYEMSTDWLMKALDEKSHLKDVEVANVLKELSATVSSYGEYTQSRQLLETALRLYETEHKPKRGSGHPVVAEALSSLAYLCFKLGEWDQGNNYLDRARQELSVNSREGIQVDPSALTATENLATAYTEIGEYKESINLLQRVAKSTQQRSALAVTLAKLSVAYYREGNWKASARVASDILQLEKIPQWEALQVLSTIVHDLGDIPRAHSDKLLERIEEHRQKALVGRNEDTLLLLGIVHRQLGNINQAQSILEAFVDQSEQTYGRNHIRVGKALTELGKVYLEQDYRIKSLRAFERSYMIHREFYGEEGHPEVAFALADLAKMVQHTGDTEQGEKLMREALKVIDQHISNPTIKGKKTIVHVKYAQMLSNYGLILRENGKLKEAQDTLEKALKLQDRCLAKNSIMTIRSLYNLGTVYHRQELRDKSESNIQTALDRMNSVDPKHPYKATIATGMAHLMADWNETSRAESELKEAINIRSDGTKYCGETHHKVGFAYETFGDIALKKHEVLSAHNYLMKAYAVRVRLIEREGSQEADYQPEVDLGYRITFIDNWRHRCDKINEKLLKCREDIKH